MINPIVSVIVPVYKVEQYLPKCVDSIINQTLQEIEIILVDDGSPDQCGKMCDTYASQDDRIVVIHKENGGLSSARNAGIAIAKADLVCFVDSDDFIESDMVEFLYKNLLKEDADISVCGIFDHYEGKTNITNDRLGYSVCNRAEAVKHELINVPVSAVNKLYKKTLFNEVLFPVGKLYEDAHTTIPLILRTSKVVFDLKPKYHYIHREQSITTEKYRPGVLSLIEANRNNMELVLSIYPNYIKETEYRYYWACYRILECMLLSEPLNNEAKEKKKEITRLLRKNTIKVINNPYFLKTRKISSLILLVCPWLFGVFAKKYLQKQYGTVS